MLTNASNGFTGAVSLVGVNATVTNGAPTVLGTSNLNGTLSVVSSGAVSQTGAVAVTGTSTIDAGTNDIVLTNTANAFGGAVSMTAVNASLSNGQATFLGGSTLGNLAVVSAGSIADSGVLVVTGEFEFHDHGQQQLGPAVELGEHVPRHPRVQHDRQRRCRDLEHLADRPVGDQRGGNLSVTTSALSQTGAIVVAGTSSFNTGASDLSFTNPGNASRAPCR